MVNMNSNEKTQAKNNRQIFAIQTVSQLYSRGFLFFSKKNFVYHYIRYHHVRKIYIQRIAFIIFEMRKTNKYFPFKYLRNYFLEESTPLPMMIIKYLPYRFIPNKRKYFFFLCTFLFTVII
jgi:hypothetical protein